MPNLSRLSISLIAMTIAAPVLAAEPAAPATPAPASHPAPATMAAPSHQAAVAPKPAMVDINNASTADLKALPGVGDADAAKIVQGRPYKDTADLLTKKIVTDSQYAKFKDQIVAGHPKS